MDYNNNLSIFLSNSSQTIILDYVSYPIENLVEKVQLQSAMRIVGNLFCVNPEWV